MFFFREGRGGYSTELPPSYPSKKDTIHFGPWVSQLKTNPSGLADRTAICAGGSAARPAARPAARAAATARAAAGAAARASTGGFRWMDAFPHRVDDRRFFDHSLGDPGRKEGH